MAKPYRILSFALLFGFILFAGCGGGEGDRPSSASRAGSATCTEVCHALTVDITGTQIAAAWAGSPHTIQGGVQCEDCHGPAGLHYGVGPIPYANPQAAQCEACHADKKGFDSTFHANSDPFNGTNLSSFTGPDKFFFQGDALNSGTAKIMGVPEFLPDGITPVTHAQHIEECSRCHNPNQRFEYGNADGSGELLKPNPGDMPNPAVSCASCHDAHQPEAEVRIAQRTDPAKYPVFRKFYVNTTGEQNDSIPGTQMAGSLYQPNGAVLPDGTVDYTKVIGTNNEIYPERICSPCHTKGKYKYSTLVTHQSDVYTQWLKSGHADRTAAPFAEFSANPSAYVNESTGMPFETGTHRATWPFDMALLTAGTSASTAQNGGYIPEGSASVANAFACYKCHNGLGSLAWQDNVQGTSGAPVVFGDATVTCITCHDSHRDASGQTMNTRRPAVMTNYSANGLTIQGNFFLDNTPVPLGKTGNGTICIFCHQGRESGLTLYQARLAPGATIAGSNFFNPHYLGTAAMLWGVNGYEYSGKSYSANAAHQNANCLTCHMANPTDDNETGGHTWKPNRASCNTSDCHAGLGEVAAKPGSVSPDVDNYRSVDDTHNYTGEAGGASTSIADSIRLLQQKIIALLLAKGIEYDDVNYPYFFQAGKAHVSDNGFKAWTPSVYKAAFNLAFTVKGLPSEGTSQADVPNASAAVHNYKYVIQLLLDGYEDLTGSPLAGAFRPVGTRPAVVYGPGQ